MKKDGFSLNKKEIQIVTLALLMSNAMNGLDSTIINTALPAIVSDLHGIEFMGWIVSIFLLTTAVSTPLWSKLGEHIGNKTAYQIATTLFVIGSFFEGMAPNVIFLIVARGIMGLGSGGMTSIPYIIYANMYKNPKKRSKVLGFVTASYSSATIIGPLLGGWIVDTISWHWVFYINVPLGLLSILIVQHYFKQDDSLKIDNPVDIKGITLLTTGLVMLLVGIEMINILSTMWVIALLVIAVALLVILGFVEKTANDPIVPSRLFKNKKLVIDFILFILIWATFIGFNQYAPMWAQGLLATSAVIGGVTQIPSAFTNFIGARSVVNLSSHMRPRVITALGIFTLMVAFTILGLSGISASYWVLLLAGCFVGFGSGLCFNVLQISVQEDADPQDVPTATSLSFLMRKLSQTFMASICGIVLNNALHAGVKQSHGQITMGMLNHLSDAEAAKHLPQHLIPQMRVILHNGLHNIMLLALSFLVVAMIICIIAIISNNKARTV